MNASLFKAKWNKVELTERAAAQQHFLDLCELLEHPKPAEMDPTGESFTFERGAEKLGGGDGWADVWKRGFFGWEYKGKHKNLDEAYRQLQQYRESLENPPLMVVCDMDRIVVRTNFTNTPVQRFDIPLSVLGTPENLQILRAVFHDPEKLRPGIIRELITKSAASKIGEIAQAMRERGLEAHNVARFLDRIVFCLFAEDVALLPDKLFTNIIKNSKGKSEIFDRFLRQIFEAMANGGYFGSDAIRHFNGNLFNDAEVVELMGSEIEQIRKASLLDWGAVDPSIFGTLFERGLDPTKRSQLGAHYTSREDIETLVEPVVMQPLRREWRQVFEQAEGLLNNAESKTKVAQNKARLQVDKLLHDFIIRLGSVKVLDPACGSGNFLYVTLQKLKDLEKEINDYALSRGYSAYTTEVGPWQLYGIEVNPYAYDLAQMTVWIGYLQWMHDNGYMITDDPVLRSMDNFKCMDAIIDLTDPENPTEPEWPEVDFIVGNPPFLGNRLMANQFSADYLALLHEMYMPRLKVKPDLCCYWFEIANRQIINGKCRRAGLLATQGIRGKSNRKVLERIKSSGRIFFAESDRPWVLNGANVHVSMVGFDNGAETECILNGRRVSSINSNLTADVDTTKASTLASNLGLSFQGSIKRGSFDLNETAILPMLYISGNPHGRPNSDVVLPYANGLDITRRNRNIWIVDFGNQSLKEAAKYEMPFSCVEKTVKPKREKANQEKAREEWWLHWCPRPEMNVALSKLSRFLATPSVAKYRLFVWISAPVYPDHQLIVFARSDDYFFGVLHSRLHEVWARMLGTQVRDAISGGRYTPTTCFETFPFPKPTSEQEALIGDAAKELNELRENWLNPPEWVKEEILEFLGSINGPWARYVHDPDERGVGTVCYPRLVGCNMVTDKLLAKRTLTNLYNQRPTWLDMAHKKLDEAVFAAYGWDTSISDDEILEKLLALNLARAAGQR